MGNKILYSLPFSAVIKLFVWFVGASVHDFLFSGVFLYFRKLNFLWNWVVFHWPWPFCCLLGNICEAIIKWASTRTQQFLPFSPQLNPFTRWVPFISNVYTQWKEKHILTCDMKMPGSCAPNGTHEWSVPPMMLNPSDPLFFGRMTSCKWTKWRRKEEKQREEKQWQKLISDFKIYRNS